MLVPANFSLISLPPTSTHQEFTTCLHLLCRIHLPLLTHAVSREVTDASWADDTHAAASAEDRIIAEMGPFENYIIGLLTNCGSLPLDRLHNMLRVFVVGEPKYEGRSQEQLGAFLTVMAGQGKIEARNGVYSRPKPQQG
jgi:hypothetical protein